MNQTFVNMSQPQIVSNGITGIVTRIPNQPHHVFPSITPQISPYLSNINNGSVAVNGPMYAIIQIVPSASVNGSVNRRTITMQSSQRLSYHYPTPIHTNIVNTAPIQTNPVCVTSAIQPTIIQPSISQKISAAPIHTSLIDTLPIQSRPMQSRAIPTRQPTLMTAKMATKMAAKIGTLMCGKDPKSTQHTSLSTQYAVHRCDPMPPTIVKQETNHMSTFNHNTISRISDNLSLQTNNDSSSSSTTTTTTSVVPIEAAYAATTTTVTPLASSSTMAPQLTSLPSQKKKKRSVESKLYRQRYPPNGVFFQQCFNTESNTYKCPNNDCKSSFKKKEGLFRHYRKHTEYAFKCNLCDAQFSRKTNLVDHGLTHTGVKPFVCTFNQCGARFQQLHSLNRHMLVKHYHIKRFQCEQCGKRYTARHNLQIHMSKKGH